MKTKFLLIIAISFSAIALTTVGLIAQNAPPKDLEAKLQQIEQLKETDPEKALNQLQELVNLVKDIKEIEQQNALLLQIITTYLDLGAIDQAIALLQTLDYDRLSPDQTISLRLMGELQVIQTYLKQQDEQKAVDFAQNLTTKFGQAKAFLEIINYYLDQQQFSQAINLAQQISADYTYEQYLANEAIITAYIKQEKYDDGIAYLDSLTNQEHQDIGFKTIAEIALEKKDLTLVEQCLSKIKTPAIKLELIKQLIPIYLDLGQKKAAINWLNQGLEIAQKEPDFQPETWTKYLLLADQEEKVEQILANHQGNDYNHAYVRYLIADGYLQVKNLEKAWQIAQTIPDGIILPLAEYRDPKYEIFDSILQQLLEANNYDFATKVALSYQNPEDQVNGLQAIAKQYIDQQNFSAAKPILDQALTITKTIKQRFIIPERNLSWTEPNASLLIALAHDYITINQKSQALIILDLANESINNFDDYLMGDIPLWRKSKAHLDLAIIYQQLSEIPKCQEMLALATQETLDSETHPRYKVEDLVTVAKIYQEIKQPQLAKQTLEKALEIANNTPEETEKQELLETINQIKL
jgi:tetratricopeptide (TPR) repeat protein